MKIVFLDIDGVLNCQTDKDRIHGCLGINDLKVKRLRKIIKETRAKIVLTSTWKSGWEENLDDCNSYGRYLTEKMALQDLQIFDKTYEQTWGQRGQGILDYLSTSVGKNCTAFIILDDECFDFKDCGLTQHHIKTSFYGDSGGLQDRHVDYAIELLT